MVGWAAQNGGTTGGAGGTTVNVSDAGALDAALKQTGKVVVRVQGMVTLSGMHRVSSDKTIIGVGANSGFKGAGGLNVHDAHNVIIRNLVFRPLGVNKDKENDVDAINVEKSTNVWIDHNDLADDPSGGETDGLVDIKHGSDYVTVSWNKTSNHHKTMLLGHSDNSGDEDRGHLRVTYHHNFFDGTETRHPRVRFGNPVHVYNNYYRGTSYGVASTMGAGVLVEANYFENVKEPTLVGYADSAPGAIELRDNQLVGSGQPQSGGGSVARVPYSYRAEAAASVKASVEAGAGAGKVGG